MAITEEQDFKKAVAFVRDDLSMVVTVGDESTELYLTPEQAAGLAFDLMQKAAAYHDQQEALN